MSRYISRLKIQIQLWEGHKIWNKVGDFLFNFCGLFRIFELHGTFQIVFFYENISLIIFTFWPVVITEKLLPVNGHLCQGYQQGPLKIFCASWAWNHTRADVFYYVNYVNVKNSVKNSTVDCKYLLYFLWVSKSAILAFIVLFWFKSKEKSCRKSKYLRSTVEFLTE